MGQCLHLDARGGRCQGEAEEGLSFCRAHGREAAAESEQPAALRRLVLRVAAFLLLVIFLLPLAVEGYRILRALLN